MITVPLRSRPAPKVISATPAASASLRIVTGCPIRSLSSFRASVSIQPLSTLAAVRVMPPVTTPGNVMPTGPFQSKWPTTSATPSATLAGVAGWGVSTLWRSCASSPRSRSTGAPLIPEPPMSTPKISM